MIRRMLLTGLLLVVMAPQALAAPAGIFTATATGQVAYVDPVVSPGETSAHEHVFFGAHPVHLTETSAELRTHATTFVIQENHSAFWMPSVQNFGVTLSPATTKPGLVYYICRHNSTICASINWFPEDFGVVEGNANATTASQNPTFRNGLSGWRCGIGGGTVTPNPPATCSDTLVANVTMGNCLLRTGVMSDAVNSNCTSVGGTPIVRIQQFFRWDVRGGSDALSITLGNEGNPAVSLHSDYFSGAEVAWSERFLNKCVRPKVGCGTNPVV